MEQVFEVSVDCGARVELVNGRMAFIESGFLHIQNEECENVAIFAKFDHVIAKPKTTSE